MADVFISYSRTDQEFVRALYNALEQRTLNAWVDWAGIPLSADWQQEINAAIEAADTCVFVISPEFARSGPCTRVGLEPLNGVPAWSRRRRA